MLPGECMPQKHKSEVGDETKATIALAGVTGGKKRSRRLAVMILSLVALLATVVTLDLTGFISIPGIGLRGVVGIEPKPTTTPSETGISTGNTSAAERARMRQRLLGAKRPTSSSKQPPRLSEAERRMAAEIFSSNEKSEPKIRVPLMSEISTPQLPSGLTREAVEKVIGSNTPAMATCTGDAMRRGESLTGKMNVELTIKANGRVGAVRIGSAKFNGSLVGECIKRRAANWKFPSFSGDSVTVAYPYVIGGGP